MTTHWPSRNGSAWTCERDSFHLPQFEVPEGESIEGYFEKVVGEGFGERMKRAEERHCAGELRVPIVDYEPRLKREIEIIRKMGFAGYFLIVWDFIRFAREKGIPVGPGRGSAAGSLVAYSLRITDIDPLEHGLIFERFLNPERISMPDIDIDFCEARRGEVIDYVTERYGRDNVAQIITFGTMKARAVTRDVGRVLDVPYADVDRIAKMIPATLDATLDKALDEVPTASRRRRSRPENRPPPRCGEASGRGQSARVDARRGCRDRAQTSYRVPAALSREPW